MRLVIRPAIKFIKPIRLKLFFNAAGVVTKNKEFLLCP